MNPTTLATFRSGFVHEVYLGFVVDIDLSPAKRLPEGSMRGSLLGCSLSPWGRLWACLKARRVQIMVSKFQSYVGLLESAR